MSDTAERVKKIVVEHLGVDEGKVTESASFVDDLGGSPRLARRSRKGTNTRSAAIRPNPSTPSTSPSNPKTWGGMSFSV
jgi:hypothetical protein